MVPTRLVLAHRALLPVAALLARESCVNGISVVCHGSDVWEARRSSRRWLEDRIMRRSSVRVVAVTSFTAGTMFARSCATVLPPGLSEHWFNMLVDAASNVRRVGDDVQLLTTFRLRDWQNKGLLQLVDAVERLSRSDVRLTGSRSGTLLPSLDDY